MTPQALKSAILQLAIQGKLVPQRPEDGVARVPAALNTEQRKARRHGKEMEPPFEIPGNWRWVRLGQLFDITRGGSPRPIKAFLTTEENGLNWIKIGDTDKNSKYINSCREKIIPSGLSKTRQVFKGDLLLTNSMSFGHPYILNIDGCIHDGWLVLHPASPELFKDFFFYLLSSPVVFKQFQTAAAGAVVQNLNSDKVAQTLVPLPPLPEQHRIVAKIEELLPLIDRYEQAWIQLEDFNRRFPADMQKSLLQMAIQGQLVEQRPEEGTAEVPAEPNTKKKKPRRHGEEFEYPFEIPESWKWAHLEMVSNSVPAKPYQILESEVRETGTFPVISQSKEYSIGFTDNASKVYHHANPVIVFGDHTAEVKYVGFDFVVGADGVKVFEPVEGLVTAKFLFYVLQFYAKDLNKVGGYSRHYKFLKTKPIPLPPLAEQKRIVAKLEELLPLCERLK